MLKGLGKLIKLVFVLGLFLFLGVVAIAVVISFTVRPAEIQRAVATNARTAEQPISDAEAPSRRVSRRDRRNSDERSPVIQYTIENEKSYDTPGVYKVNLEISVATKPSEQQLRNLLLRAFEKTRRKGPGRFFKHPNAVYIFAYAKPRYHAQAAGSWIGQLLYNENNGDKAPEINIAEDRLSIMFEPPADRFGLTEAQRKEVYYRLVDAEDRAMNKARANSNDVSKFDGKKAGRLQERYEQQICKKYKITREQAKQIGLEGAKKGWPMPPSD